MSVNQCWSRRLGRWVTPEEFDRAEYGVDDEDHELAIDPERVAWAESVLARIASWGFH